MHHRLVLDSLILPPFCGLDHSEIEQIIMFQEPVKSARANSHVRSHSTDLCLEVGLAEGRLAGEGRRVAGEGRAKEAESKDRKQRSLGRRADRERKGDKYRHNNQFVIFNFVGYQPFF